MSENFKKNKMAIILCTLPDDILITNTLVNTLLHQKLAACISTLNKIHSFYYWQGTLKNHSEIQLIIKTKYSLKEIIFKTIKKLHPYKIPELLILSISDGDKEYLSWMTSVLR